MLPAGSVIPGVPGIGLLWMLLPQALFSAVTWVLGRKLLTCCRSWRRRQKHRQACDTNGAEGRGALRLGWGPSAGAFLFPKVEGSRQGKQAVCAGVDENRRRFI